MFTKILAVAVISLGATLGQATAAEYYCKIQKKSSGGDAGSLPPDLYVWHDEKTGEVKVLDGLIQGMFGDPIEGQVAVDNAKRITFAYSVKKVPGKNQYGGKVLAHDLAYRLTIQKSDLSATMSMKPRGFRNTFRSTGTCQVK
ncbi:hypothetical protein K3X13_04920 [Aliiroseovarius crassostreae]|uniref:hypothetical protein n=1 Tax=Aliiroseovarius crassostreae TaxID=154981 RepID=UPI0021FFCF0E|nr:hypothetical protein [Aliiroseovarius crassostreae]UWP93182.1 hypothetical protein K3X13_04920 [Aliiroseovarius crassostreae]